VEIKTTKDTADVGHLQKAADFVHAYILGARRRLGGRAAGAARALSGLRLMALPVPAVGGGLARDVSLAAGPGRGRPASARSVDARERPRGRQQGAGRAQPGQRALKRAAARQASRWRMRLRCCGWTTCTSSASRSRTSRRAPARRQALRAAKPRVLASPRRRFASTRV